MEPDREAILKALEHVIDPEFRRPSSSSTWCATSSSRRRAGLGEIALTVAGCPLPRLVRGTGASARGEMGCQRVRLGFDVMTPEEKSALDTRFRGGTERSGDLAPPRTRVIAVVPARAASASRRSRPTSRRVRRSASNRCPRRATSTATRSRICSASTRSRRGRRDDRPARARRLKLMSIGFFLEENAPIMWRGPMCTRRSSSSSRTSLGRLDTLVVDMPPGTGDVAISLGQLLPRAGDGRHDASAPRSGGRRARRADGAEDGHAALGVVENMSYLVGTGEELFGPGGGEALADETGVPLLARSRSTRPCVRPPTPAHRSRRLTRLRSGPRCRRTVASVAASRAGTIPSRSRVSRRPRVGCRVLRSRSNADLALELAVTRSGIAPTGSSPSPRPYEGNDRPARLHAVRGGDVAEVGQDGGDRDRLPEGAARRGDAGDRRGRVVELAFRPHVYLDALGLVALHRKRGERSFILSAALEEIVDALVSELDFDGGLGWAAEVENGVYTGRVERRLDGFAKAAALGGARGDRGHRPSGVDGVLGLGQRRALPRGCRSCRRRESRPGGCVRSLPRAPGVCSGSARKPSGDDDRGRRPAALGDLGLESGAVDTLVAHFADAERRGKDGHGFVPSRGLATLGFDPAARPVLVESEEGVRAVGWSRRARLSRTGRDRAGDARRSARACARGRCATLLS